MNKLQTLLIAGVLPLLVAGCAGKAPAGPSLDDVFASRRSIRAYDAGKTVTEAQVRELMAAVQNAPSWANQQPSKYYVAIGAEKREADALRTLFEIPEDEMVLAVIALGYRAQDPTTPVHRPLDEIAKFF